MVRRQIIAARGPCSREGLPLRVSLVRRQELCSGSQPAGPLGEMLRGSAGWRARARSEAAGASCPASTSGAA